MSNAHSESRRPAAGLRHALSVLLVILALAPLVPNAIAALKPKIENPHGAMKEACETCHSAKGWKPAQISSKFDHSKYGHRDLLVQGHNLELVIK